MIRSERQLGLVEEASKVASTPMPNDPVTLMRKVAKGKEPVQRLVMAIPAR